MFRLLFLCLLFFCCHSHCSSANEENVVTTQDGPVRGSLKYTVEAKIPYLAFQGVPFAEPPIGNLRFEAPLPKKPWTTIINATQDPSPCLQSGDDDVVGSEDCLYLNIYAPQLNQTKETKELLPVIIWIFGGAFVEGSCAYSSYKPDYIIDQGVLVVSINYRLGIFGFFSLEDLVAPGNNGLKDQLLALQWLKKNIDNFGGDPNRITVWGQSAGSASISYLMQSPKAKGVFNQAIMESGNSLMLWSLSRNPAKTAKQVAKGFDVDLTNSSTIKEGLKKVNASLLYKKSDTTGSLNLLKSNPRDGFIFAPVIEPEHEGAFFTKRSHEALLKGELHKVPCLVGYNSLEAMFEPSFTIRAFLTVYDANISMVVPIDANINDLIVKTKAGLVIKTEYFGLTLIAAGDYRVAKFISDDMFSRPVHEFVRLISRFSPVYYYRFSYMGGQGDVDERIYPGVSHTEELGYLFVNPNNKTYPANATDTLTRKRMVNMWSNFVKYGNPTPKQDALLQNLTWPVANIAGGNDLTYFNIDYNLSVEENPDQASIDFWDKFYNLFGTPPYDTY